ncbi:hypothetical protein GUJ93_ZPchr0011g27858 [Zizania palustris]|uniref:Agglutinin domain-containing protein n=1 Tax=Zizania palustris TaxID=103762 RepID=A0A8J6BMN6_ZIZPA|nr:hypothetical protein GUJ93_ZPchr0011g27858 [Zizania palustris]
MLDGHNYLQFAANDIGDSTVVNTTTTNDDGTIRIKNNYFDRFWRRSPNWIWADSSDTSNSNVDTLFKVIKIDDYFTIKNLGNNYFCKRLTADGKDSCLNAATATITTEAKLILEEAVISRQIYNVDYDLSNSRIYGTTVLTLSSDYYENRGTESDTATLTLTYKETSSTMWDSTTSWKLGVNSTVKAGIPVIAETTVQVNEEFSGEYKWSSSLEKTIEQKNEYKVIVPPKKKVTVTLIASKGSCDVPFSYKQEDVMYDGRVVTYDMVDGIYTDKEGDDVGGWIIRTAHELEDDLSKPSCTLFKLHTTATKNRTHLVRFHLAQLGKHVSMSSSSHKANNKVTNHLHVRREEIGGDNILSAYTVLDLSEEKQLPKYIAIKGDNGKYLKAYFNKHNYLQFAVDDVGDSLVLNTTTTNDDGTIRIKNNYYDKFWRRSPNWIWPDSSDTSNNNIDTLFKVIKIDDYFAIQNMGNNYFCKRLTADGKDSCLNAGTATITTEAKLILEEPIISRQVYNVDYDLSNSRIYGTTVLTMSTATGVNRGTVSDTAKLTLSYKETSSTMWDSTASWKLGVTSTIKAGIPVIAETSVEINDEFSGEYKWSSSLEKTVEQKIEYEVTVPPMTKVTVSLIASKGSCDVPFSYKQEDIMYDGRVVTYDMDDGIYTGTNCYDFQFEKKEENI